MKPITPVKPIHPFPARMAPDIALSASESLLPNSIVLDPMAGSGTVVRTVAQYGHKAIGYDVDPLAVLLTRAWTTPVDTEVLKDRAVEVIQRAEELSERSIQLPWIDNDQETGKFIDYWFAEKQQKDLRRLSYVLKDKDDPISDVLRVCLSRLIITKWKGASLAADVSHSRPHRVRTTNDFEVIREFSTSVNFVASRLKSQPPQGNAEVKIGDARNLTEIKDESVDAVITSPPYLSAIDYLRGHRLSLVWFGYKIGDLRAVRSGIVGAEKSPDPEADITLAQDITKSMGEIEKLPARRRRMIYRYGLDLLAIMRELERTLKPSGMVSLVVGNSQHQDVFVKNTEAVVRASEKAGLQFVSETTRELPQSRRYLPPPSSQKTSDLKKRMKTESVLSFKKPQKQKSFYNL